jgi:TRAP-type C4-dicarboxylate transport system permease small subunit
MDSAMVRALNLVDKVLNYIEVSVLVVTGVLLLGSLFYAALVRYAHLGSFPEETELSWLLYSWMVFIGGSSVLRKGDHPHVSAVREKFGWRYEVALYVISVVYLSGLVYVLVSYRWLYAAQKTAVMQLSLTYFYGAALVGLSFMVVRYVIKILNLVRTKGGSEAP